jgi:hypothetical protein
VILISISLAAFIVARCGTRQPNPDSRQPGFGSLTQLTGEIAGSTKRIWKPPGARDTLTLSAIREYNRGRYA